MLVQSTESSGELRGLYIHKPAEHSQQLDVQDHNGRNGKEQAFLKPTGVDLHTFRHGLSPVVQGLARWVYAAIQALYSRSHLASARVRGSLSLVVWS
jgi:hypothetical protein